MIPPGFWDDCEYERSITELSRSYTCLLFEFKVDTSFNYMKPNVPIICDLYNVRSPHLHLPVNKHDFAIQLIKYFLFKLLNEDENISKIADKVLEQTFCIFKLIL